MHLRDLSASRASAIEEDNIIIVTQRGRPKTPFSNSTTNPIVLFAQIIGYIAILKLLGRTENLGESDEVQ